MIKKKTEVFSQYILYSLKSLMPTILSKTGFFQKHRTKSHALLSNVFVNNRK